MVIYRAPFQGGTFGSTLGGNTKARYNSVQEKSLKSNNNITNRKYINPLKPKSRKGNNNMKNLFFCTKNKTYQITKNENGTVTFFPEEKNAGMLIAQRGGIASFLSLCQEDERSYEEFAAAREEEKKAEQERKKATSQQRAKAEEEAIIKAYNELLAQYGMDINHIDKSVIVDATISNLYTIMRYMRVTNWGLWKLPTLSQGYYVHPYDCDGKAAVTITLDEGITDEDGKNIKKLQYGAPMGHLNDYANIARL